MYCDVYLLGGAGATVGIPVKPSIVVSKVTSVISRSLDESSVSQACPSVACGKWSSDNFIKQIMNTLTAIVTYATKDVEDC